MTNQITIVTYPDERLETRSKHVTDFDDSVRQLANDLEVVIRATSAVGIAAPQIGKNVRVIAVGKGLNEGRFDGVLVVANPRIVAASSETTYEREGCVSFPGVFAPLHRKKWIEVVFQNPIDGGVHREKIEGLEARVWQHSIDVLDGVLMIDRLQDMRRKSFLAKYKKAQRKGKSNG